jgi:hypothetical protein
MSDIGLFFFNQDINKYNHKKQALTQQTTAHKTVMALKEHTRKDLELKFRNVYVLIKKK